MAFRVLDFSDGFTSSTTPSVGGLNVSSLLVYANDAAFVTANGPAGNGDIYYNTTLNVVRYYDGNLAAWTSVVSKDGVETITNKTITGAGNSISGLLHGTQVDNPSSGVHGVTGSVVGTSDVQSLTNKTIDDSANTLTVRAASVDSGASSNGDVLTSDGSGNATWQAPGVASFTNYAIYASEAAFVTANGAAQAGDAFYNSTTNKVRYYNGTAWVTHVGDTEIQTLTNKTISYATNSLLVSEAEVDSGAAAAGKVLTADGAGNATWETGGGGVGLNFIDNWDFEAGGTGWTMYDDGASATPVNGTGGTPTSTFTVSGTSPLDGLQSLIINHPASNEQGEGISYDFTIDNAYKNAALAVQFNYQIASGTFVSGPASDVRVWIYDVTNSVLIQPSTYTIDGGGSSPHRFYGVFQPSMGNSTSFRLIFHFATTTTSAFGLKIDNIQVSPADASANDVPVMAASVSGTVATTASGVVINFPTVDFDPDGLYSAGQFTVPSAGKYVLRSFGVAATTAVNFGAYLNGSLYKSLGTGDNTNGTYSGSVIIPAQAGDLIDLRSTNSSTGGLDSTSWLQLNKLSSGSIEAVPSVVAAKYKQTGSSTPGAGNQIDFATKIFDTHDAVTTGASWKFTAPYAGYYKVETCLYAPGGAATLAMYKGGSSDTIIGELDSAGVETYGTVVYLASGDYVDLRPSTGVSIGTADTTISIFKVPAPASTEPSMFGEIYLTNGNGHGSTNTKIRRYTTTQINRGDDVSYVDSATLGAEFTINSKGKYALTIVDAYSASNSQVGASINSTQLTTSIDTITALDRLVFSNTSAAGFFTSASVVFDANAGDVVRVHDNGNNDDTSAISSVRMVRLA